MKEKVVSGIILKLLILSMVILTSNVSHAYVQSETVLYVDPSSTQALVHSEFTINVTVADVVDLYAFGFYLGYDPTVLEISTVLIQRPFESPIIELNETEGYVSVIALLPPDYPKLSGTFVLTSITFRAAFPGNSTLNLYDTILIGSEIKPIPHTTIDGFVNVYDAGAAEIIHPQPGQFSNYHMRFYYPSPGYGWWNTSYNEYVQPHVINTTHIIGHPYMNDTYWCTVDTTSRLVTDAHPEFWWDQTWYILWIETNVTVGSTINWWTDTATIVGSQTLYVVGRYVDCWVANASYYEDYDLTYYDKMSGLLVMIQGFDHGELYVDLTLNATNIPIGGLTISTAVYFNLNPSPVSVGETVTLKGILVDELSQPLSDETVRLYARQIGGSWIYITSLTTNGYGIFMLQATIPSTVTGTFILAIYYPGGEIYEPCYNFAVLIVQ